MGGAHRARIRHAMIKVAQITGAPRRFQMKSWPRGVCWSGALAGLRHDLSEMLDTSGDQSPAPPEQYVPSEEQRGCLFALSQPPLMIFLAVVGSLLLAAALHDLLVL
ncbi:hypothetical protein GCM10023082_66950 [Streptomyces tremellae]|uniref:Uncharacterized protein n=2 Tax=Streptomyces TaxID=1883 RepID=A0ABP7GGI0_9ACTN